MDKENEATTAIAKKETTAVTSEKTNWARLHGSWRERIERMLPDPQMIDQFMYCAETQYGKNRQAFENCTPVSLMSCLMTSAKYGILPDGRNAYLIPYGKECTLQFDYKGLVHVVLRDGVAKKIYADVVCANDVFEFENGAVTQHIINLPRGEVVGAYCDITLSNGEHQFEIMDIDEIKAVRAKSRGANSPSSPWNEFFKEMAKKTVFRRATKWLKLSPDVLDAIRGDDESGFDFSGATATKREVKSLFSNPNHIPSYPIVELQQPVQVNTEEPKAEKKKEAVTVETKIKMKDGEVKEFPF